MADPLPKLVLTGALGLIGSILREGLAKRHDVRGIDLSASEPKILAADVADMEAVARAFDQIGEFERLVHLAADRRVDAPWSSLLPNNILGTYNVYTAAHAHGVRRIVFASSNHVIGMVEEEGGGPEVASVTDPVRPDSLYAVSKLFGEGLARYFYERHGLQSICLRIGSVLDDDDPTREARFLRTWLSHRDLVHLVDRSLKAEVEFGIYYGVSDNRDRFWSLESARSDLGYRPVDDAAELAGSS